MITKQNRQKRDVLSTTALFTIVASVDGSLEDRFHLTLALLIRGHLACDKDLSSLQRYLNR